MKKYIVVVQDTDHEHIYKSILALTKDEAKLQASKLHSIDHPATQVVLEDMDVYVMG